MKMLTFMDLGGNLKDLKKINGSTDELSRLQSNLENWASSVQKSGLSDGRLLQGVVCSAGGVNNVEHKLNRELIGWIVVGQSAQATIWDSQAANVFKTKFLALNCSANVILNLWVF